MPLNVSVAVVKGEDVISLAQNCSIEVSSLEVVPVIFKVFTRHPAKFRITPHEGVLMAKESIVVSVSMRIPNGGDAVTHSESNPVGGTKREEFRVELRGALGMETDSSFASKWKGGVPDVPRTVSAVVDTRPLPPNALRALSQKKVDKVRTELDLAEASLTTSRHELATVVSAATRLERTLHHLQFGVVVPVWVAALLVLAALVLPRTL